VAKKYPFFIRIIVDHPNLRSVNYLHKRILEVGLRR
jgi:hypothetical protein